MFPAVVAPLLIAGALAMGVTALHRRLPPRFAAQLVWLTIVVVVVAAVPTLWLVSFGFVRGLPVVGPWLGWCDDAMPMSRPVSAWVGVPCTVVSVVGAVRAVRLIRELRRMRRDSPGPLEIAVCPDPYAYTLPGRGGRVVFSSGLVDLLSPRERGIVYAHEAAHARHRHDRYLLTGQLASTVVPLLIPLVRRLQYSLERWADESAAYVCGDRKLVAQTLGKVALSAAPSPRFALGFTGLGAAGRVRALLADPLSSPSRSLQLVIWVAAAWTGVMAAYQLHHLARLVAAICPG
ncbi:MAG: M56 family metallopeptidase [Ilumatobacteraceae bacterium]